MTPSQSITNGIFKDLDNGLDQDPKDFQVILAANSVCFHSRATPNASPPKPAERIQVSKTLTLAFARARLIRRPHHPTPQTASLSKTHTIAAHSGSARLGMSRTRVYPQDLSNFLPLLSYPQPCAIRKMYLVNISTSATYQNTSPTNHIHIPKTAEGLYSCGFPKHKGLQTGECT